jgi:hypothetical protein
MDAGTWGSTGDAGSLLGNAAKRVRASAAEQASAGAEGRAGGKSGRSIFGFIFDAFLYTSLAAVTAGGIAYSRYSIPEVEDALKDAEQQEQQDGSIVNQAWVQLLRQYLAVVVPLDQRVSIGMVAIAWQHHAVAGLNSCIRVRVLVRQAHSTGSAAFSLPAHGLMHCMQAPSWLYFCGHKKTANWGLAAMC